MSNFNKNQKILIGMAIISFLIYVLGLSISNANIFLLSNLFIYGGFMFFVLETRFYQKQLKNQNEVKKEVVRRWLMMNDENIGIDIIKLIIGFVTFCMCIWFFLSSLLSVWYILLYG